MNIALVSEHASPLTDVGSVDAGGQNVHVGALASALARRGHRVTVHTRASGGAGRVDCGDGVVVELHPCGPPGPLPKDELLPHLGQLAAGLAASWRRDPPDIVHAHFWMSGLAALDAATDLEVPVLQTFHALGSVKRRWQGSADTSPGERIDAERDLGRRATRVIATCTDEVHELVAMGLHRADIDVVPCGVDTRAFTPGAPQPHPPRVVTVGRLVPRKGVDDAIEAVAALPGVELVVAGGPPTADLDAEAEVARLRAVAARSGARVRFGGQVGRDALPSLLRSADAVLCLPWYEPFGIVPLEAMACGVPVVGSAVGGLLDTVVEGVTGLLVPPRDPAAAAAAVGLLVADPGLRASMGAAGRRRACRRYDWTRVAEQTERSYLRALLGSRSDVGRREAVG